MRLDGQRESENVEDRRRRGPMRRPGMAIGCGGMVMILLLAVITGQDPMQLLNQLGGESGQVSPEPIEPVPSGGPDDDSGLFMKRILGSTEDVWNDLFNRMGQSYQEPRLVLFSDAVESGCGVTSAAVGPFYCPADAQVYLDQAFFRDLDRRFGAPGDFAQAYVVAHEVGHHVQNLLGISSQVSAMQQRSDQEGANQLSVRLELQADCFAGVWGFHANQRARLLEPGDVEEGLRAAAAIGDDRMQKMSTGWVQPESWTHGSSEMRVEWLNRGLTSGDPEACDTFGSMRRR